MPRPLKKPGNKPRNPMQRKRPKPRKHVKTIRVAKSKVTHKEIKNLLEKKKGEGAVIELFKPRPVKKKQRKLAT